MTYSTFVLQYPEFAAIDQPFVQAWLDAANLEIDREVWGAKADSGQGLLAAHKMALSPMGRNARTDKPTTTTVYGVSYDEMVLQVGSGYRVTL